MSICLNECAVFTQGFFDPFGPPFVAYYDFSGNTILPILTENPWGFGITDIANTTNKLWVLINTGPPVIKEYNLSLCPISTTLSRTFTYTGFPQNFPDRGLEAINNNNLLSTGNANNGFVPVIRYNISTNNLVPTVLFNLPYGRQLAGDLIYVPSTPTGPKIITLTIGGGALDVAPRFISQFDVTTGVIEMDKNIPINLIFSPWGLFTKNNKIYIQDGSNSTVWNIGLNFPYPLSYVNQISYTGATSFGGGASNLAKCNTVSFKKQKPYISFPGIVSIDQIISCQDWENPTSAIPIYVQPEGLIIVDETRLFLNSLKTDPVQKGYWVSDGTQTYLIGDGGLIKEIQECDFKFDNVISFDPIGGINSTVRLYSDNLASNPQSTVLGGNCNTSSGNGSTISGGFSNTSSNCCSTIAGGSLNFAGAEYSFIGGGRANTTDDSYGVIMGGENNFAGCECSVIGGGQFNSSIYEFSTILGGLNNNSNAPYGSILGGCNNTILGSYSSVVGGDNNIIFSNSSVIGGGTNNESYSSYGTIGGGSGNKIYLDGATIAGGQNNTAIEYNSSVGGGFGNTVVGGCSFVVGNSNVVSGDTSFVLSNSSTLNANNSVILGGSSIVGSSDNTVYVPQLNISTLNTGTTVNNLGIDSNGFVIVGTDVTGLTQSLSDVIAVGPNTGGDIIMTNTTSILSENGQGFIQVNDLGLDSTIVLRTTASGDTVDSVYDQQNNSIQLHVRDNSVNQSSVQLSTKEVKLTTIDSSLGTTGTTDTGVVINGYKYNTSTLLTSDATPTEIIKIENFSGELVGGVTNVKVWCNAFDVATSSSGLSQEFTSAYLVDGSSVLSQLSLTPTTNLNYSTFPPSVTANLIYTTFPGRVILEVTGLPSADVFWKCRARWSQ